jgi:hypothetical protein
LKTTRFSILSSTGKSPFSRLFLRSRPGHNKTKNTRDPGVFLAPLMDMLRTLKWREVDAFLMMN